jgi:tetratricopeptide (TPR) repeat protein/TolB-like protein
VSECPARLPAGGFLPRLRQVAIESRIPRVSRRIFLGAALTALAVLLGLQLVQGSLERRGRNAMVRGASPGYSAAPVAPTAIAVLPFSVKGSGADDWMREGMVDLLSTNLDGMAGLRAIASRTVLARWREHVSSADSPDLQTALEVARRTGGRYALIGSATRVGPNVRFAAEIYDLQGGSRASNAKDPPGTSHAISLGRRQVEGRASDLVPLVDRLSVQLLSAIPGLTQGDGGRLDLGRITTSSPAALKAFLEGEAAYRLSDFERAVAGYRRAVETDSTFALAFYRLAVVYPQTADWYTHLLDSYLDRAIQLADRLPVRDQDRAKAQSALQRSPPQGLELLRKMTFYYPADAEAWFQYGEACYLKGYEAFVERSDCDRALARAMDIDSTFAPAYTYRIAEAFNYFADSTAAANLIASFARVAPASDVHRWNRLALMLAFGDSVTRAQAWQSLDTLSLAGTSHVGGLLQHPESRSQQELVLLARSRRNDPEGASFALALFFNHLARGKLRSATDHLDRAVRLLGRTSAVLRPAALYTAVARGLPMSRVDLERELYLVPGDTSVDLRVFFAGAFAADQRRWAHHRATVERIRRHAQRLGGARDSTGARFVEGMARALEGYALWKRGQPEQALKLLESAQMQVTGRSPLSWDLRGSALDLNSTIRFWLGKLLLEFGREAEAERYFKSFWHDPALPHYYLGRINEDLGQFDESRDAYGLFVKGWQDAEPELQPMVEEARSAVARLASVIRE